jgi:hypothetical protein
MDTDEDGIYDFGEPFYDFYNNGGSELGVRNGPDSLFNGVLCSGAACPSDPLKRSAGIGARNLIILSGSQATITNLTGALSLPINSATPVSFWVRDTNGNPMPGGTKVTAATAGGGLSVSNPASLTVACSTAAAGAQVNGATVFNYVITSGGTAGAGTVSLTVETPKGFATISVPYTVTVTP